MSLEHAIHTAKGLAKQLEYLKVEQNPLIGLSTAVSQHPEILKWCEKHFGGLVKSRRDDNWNWELLEYSECPWGVAYEYGDFVVIVRDPGWNSEDVKRENAKVHPNA